jgi:hypothetical protein
MSWFAPSAVGDILPVKAKGPEGFTVLALDAPRSLVLGDSSLLRPEAPFTGAPRGTWTFSLAPLGDAGTHLTVRVRVEYQPSVAAALLRPLVIGLHDFMQRRQLRGLKQRAERTP